MGRLTPQPQTVPASISAKSSMKLSRPGGELVLHGTEVPQQTERGRSIATKTRCPPDVRSSLNFRHNVAGARSTLKGLKRHAPLSFDHLVGECEQVWRQFETD